MTIDEAIEYLEAEMPYHRIGVRFGCDNKNLWEAIEMILEYAKKRKK